MHSKQRFALAGALIAALVFVPAYADNNGNNGNNGNSQNQGGDGGNGGNGGQGGQGGNGGTGYGGQGGKGGTGVGIGGNQKQGQGQAQGQGQQQSNTNNVGNGVGNFSPSSSSKSDSTSISGSSSKSDSKSSSNSGAVAGSNSGGNKMSTNVNFEAQDSLHYSGEYTVKNTPGIALGSLYPSSPCMGTSNVGGSGPGFSIGFGSSWKDDDCGIRETARSFQGMGMTKDAVAVLCSSPYAAKAPACSAPAGKPAAKAEAQAPAVVATATQAPSRNTDASATRYEANGQTWTRANVSSDWVQQQK